MSTIKRMLNSRFGFFTFAVILFWLKTYTSYLIDFDLGVSGAMQQFILFINPLATTVILFSIAFYFSKPKSAYIALFVVYFALSVLLFANILYYREFTDFITINTILGAKNIANGIGASTFAMIRLQDLLYWLDFVILLVVLLSKKIPVSMDPRLTKKRSAVATTILGVTLFAGNLTLAESDRPQLLLRTFDRNYIVKYLGLNFFTAYDGYQTAQANQIKASADESDMENVFNFVHDHYAAPDKDKFGIAKGRNVIYIHLESFQQFLLDYELEDENGEKHEVTPFLNSIYHGNDSYSFKNAFHQVGQGKTSDSEMLLENSLFGLPQGGAFSSVGSTNTFESATKILHSQQDYTSAVFHGNVGSFWNRDDTYKSLGIDYFFDSDYYEFTDENTLEYGMKDKIFFQQSIQYLEQLPQPFYTKFITVSNHFPYPLDEENIDIPAATTGDATIDNYFVTAHYLDQAVKEFFDYLKETGLYDNSVIVLYGDHYGISNARNKTLAPLLGKDPAEWTDYDNAMLQRVPVIYHVPGVTDGGIQDTFGGQVDMLPTLLHLLGVNTQDYAFMGTDLLSKDHDQNVTFRNGNVVTPEYTIIGSTVYDTDSGEVIGNISDLPEDQKEEIQAIKDKANTQLSTSDSILQSDLLRFYTPEGMKDFNRADYNYQNQMERLQEVNAELGENSTSLIQQNNGESTVPMYQTDAPELQDQDETTSSDEGNSSQDEGATDNPDTEPSDEAE